MDAIVLAAGNGDRFAAGGYASKLLYPFLGKPLLLRTLDALEAAGITRVGIVLGYRADAVRQLVANGAPPGLDIQWAVNSAWHLENGLSVLTAQPLVRGSQHFAIVMGDHVFEPSVLRRLLRYRLDAAESVLAVDAHPASSEIAAEAVKVRREGGRIVAIDKQLTEYDAVDTGLFVCSSAVFDAIESARLDGDTTLSGGIRALARRGLMCADEIGDAMWRDIDTVDDLRAAESLFAATAGA